jgi:type 1 glutamine amidotransferase
VRFNSLFSWIIKLTNYLFIQFRKRRPLVKKLLSLSLTMVLSLLLSSQNLPAQEKTAPKKAHRILMVTYSGGFTHGAVKRKNEPLAHSEKVMTELGVTSGLFRVDCTQNPEKDFTKENLQNYDIVLFYTTGDRKKWEVSEETFDYFFNDWLKKKGHGFIGTHSAADTLKDYEPYWDMIGGSFNGHPWGSGSTVTITVHDQNHPVSKVWGSEFEIKDEIYRFRNWQPEKVKVLMSLNMEKTSKKEPYHVPIAWVKDYGEGKAMHMSLGHNESVWSNETYQNSLLGGIKWILGYAEGDATPNPDLSAKEHEKAIAAAKKK